MADKLIPSVSKTQRQKRPWALALLALFVLPMLGCPSLDKVLRSYGYLPVEPPSTLLVPGTIVWVRKNNPREFGLVCTAEQVLGAGSVYHQSNTKNISLFDATTDGVTVTTNLLRDAQAQVSGQSLKTLEMSLSNAQVLEIDDAAISARGGQTPTACLAAIRGRRRNGDSLTMIASSLQADVTYVAGWNSNTTLSGEGKISALQNIAVQLNLNASQVTETSIAAQALIWGVRDDSYLVTLVAPEYVDVAPDDPNRELLVPSQASFGRFMSQTFHRW